MFRHHSDYNMGQAMAIVRRLERAASCDVQGQSAPTKRGRGSAAIRTTHRSTSKSNKMQRLRALDGVVSAASSQVPPTRADGREGSPSSSDTEEFKGMSPQEQSAMYARTAKKFHKMQAIMGEDTASSDAAASSQSGRDAPAPPLPPWASRQSPVVVTMAGGIEALPPSWPPAPPAPLLPPWQLASSPSRRQRWANEEVEEPAEAEEAEAEEALPPPPPPPRPMIAKPKVSMASTDIRLGQPRSADFTSTRHGLWVGLDLDDGASPGADAAASGQLDAAASGEMEDGDDYDVFAFEL